MSFINMSDKVQILLLHKKKIIQLQKFLKKYWNKNHIFVKNKKFLIWQHQNKNRGWTLSAGRRCLRCSEVDINFEF